MKLSYRFFYLSLTLLTFLTVNAAQAKTYRFVVTSAANLPVSDVVIAAILPQTATPSMSTAKMDQANIAFSPYVLPISAGDKVTFPNSDNIRHHVYSFSAAKPFDLKLYSGEPEKPVIFDKPGVIVLGCNIHDNMVGYIYVSNSRFHASTDFNGESSLAVPTPITEISVWHPGLSIDSQKELLLSLKSLQQIDGVYQINLLMGQPATNPQAMQAPNRDRFKRFMKPKE